MGLYSSHLPCCVVPYILDTSACRPCLLLSFATTTRYGFMFHTYPVVSFCVDYHERTVLGVVRNFTKFVSVKLLETNSLTLVALFFFDVRLSLDPEGRLKWRGAGSFRKVFYKRISLKMNRPKNLKFVNSTSI